MNAPFPKSLVQTTLRKMGNSTGMILPKAILDQLGLASGAKIELHVEDGKVIAVPAKRRAWEDWEEDARRVGAGGLTEEESDWLNMPSDFDDEWEW